MMLEHRQGAVLISPIAFCFVGATRKGLGLRSVSSILHLMTKPREENNIEHPTLSISERMIRVLAHRNIPNTYIVPT